MQADYIFFYLEGRSGKALKADIDTDAIAEQVLAGKGSIHELLHGAVSDAAKGLEVDRQRRRFLADYEDEIKESGGDQDAAYRHFLDGKIDELVYVLEPEVIECLEGDEDDEDDDEEDEDDEEGEE